MLWQNLKPQLLKMKERKKYKEIFTATSKTKVKAPTKEG